MELIAVIHVVLYDSEYFKGERAGVSVFVKATNDFALPLVVLSQVTRQKIYCSSTLNRL